MRIDYIWLSTDLLETLVQAKIVDLNTYICSDHSVALTKLRYKLAIQNNSRAQIKRKDCKQLNSSTVDTMTTEFDVDTVWEKIAARIIHVANKNISRKKVSKIINAKRG
ncbi:15764_t:CDS:2, partial [Dentiscutata heterogama]